MSDREEIAAALAIVCESCCIKPSARTTAFWIQELSKLPQAAVLRGLARAAKELSRNEFCFAALIDRAKAETRAPDPSLPALPSYTAPTAEEKERMKRLAAELAAKLAAGGSINPAGAEPQKKRHWTESEADE